MKKTAPLILFILFSTITPAYCLNYEGYEDDLADPSNIRVLENVIHNSTGQLVGFNQSDLVYPITEDLTTYTEYEENEGAYNQVQVQNATTLYYYSDLFYGAYLVYDFGADYFEDFTITFDLYVDGAIRAGINHHVRFGFYNQLGDRSDITTNYTELGMNRDTLNRYRYIVNNHDNGVNNGSGWVVDASIYRNWQYVRCIKEGTSIKWLVYNDSARSNLWYSYNATTNNDMRFRYFYSMISYDLNNYDNTIIYGWVKNFEGLNFSGPLTGHIYTENLLDGISQNATSLLYESDIADPNVIDFEFSRDNSTWAQLYPEALGENQGAYNLEGLGYDQLYVRANFSRPQGTGSCDLKQFTVIYPGAGADPSRGIALVLFILGIIIAYGLVTR